MDPWIRIGRGGLPRVALIVLVLALVIALFIAAPMAQLGSLVSGTPLPFGIGYLGGVVVVFVLIAPLVLPRATRPLSIDASHTVLRVGLRTIPASDVRHAYRLPDGQFDGRFQVQLAVPGLDPLVGVSAARPAELSSEELDALLALLANSPIEPDVGVTLRPPLGGELGSRDDAQRFDDQLADVLLPFERMTYSKPTLIAELEKIRDALAGEAVGESSATIRDLGLVTPGTTNAPLRRRTLSAVPAQVGPARGFWALQGGPYNKQISDVEQWLRSVGHAVAAPRDWQWWVGLLLVVFGFASPWLSAAAAFPATFYSSTISIPTMMGVFVFFLLSWPFIVWPGFVLMWRARIGRYERARRATLAVRRQRVTVPQPVAAFFGPVFPEIALLNPLLWLVLAESMVLLVGGLTSITLGAGQVENWDALPLGLPVGVTMVLASVPLFAWGVRLIRDGAAQQLRADAFWRAIASPPA
ncbi:hypothetical protein BH10ACT7_BH10ACT7_16400 [soil metagenome]